MPLDWDDKGQFWDSGLTWDVDLTPGAGDVTPWLNLITSPHSQKPKFIEMMTALLQPFADLIANMAQFITDFDLDEAVGVQLDTIGRWIGVSRNLRTPLEGVYFTFDDGPGFDIGILWGPGYPLTGLVQLPDPQYRILLGARIAANHWDGTIQGAYDAFAILFGNTGFRIAIIDNQDMSIDEVLCGPIPDAVTLALFVGGYLDMKPSGVRINNYIASANSSAKIFMFDAAPDSPAFAGFDVGAFPNFYPGE